MTDGKPALNAMVLQVVYDHLRERGTWPTFTQVDRVLDRRLGIEDARAALAALPAEFVPRSWGGVGVSDTDEVRLTLRGVAACAYSRDDLQLVASFLRWAAEQERVGEGEDPVVVTAIAFARHSGLPLNADDPSVEEGTPELPEVLLEGDEPSVDEDTPEPPEVLAAQAQIARVGVLAQGVPTFWNSAGHPSQERWRWTFTLSRGVRQFRSLNSVDRLLELEDEFWRQVRESRGLNMDVHSGQLPDQAGDEVQSDADPLDVLLTILRPEVVEAAATQLRSGLFDDAIFAAFRRVEHEIQQRTGLTSIGDRLVGEAFRTATDRISISGRARDADRLVEMFGGALGLHKGDRSHKDKPALPCRSRSECVRLLAHASALLDLLDRGVEQAPSVDGCQQRDDILELSVQRVGPAVQVWLDDRQCRVRSRAAATLTVDIDGASTGFHDLYLIDGTRQGPAVPIFVSRELGSDNWHRVDGVGIRLFRNESGDPHQDVQGVRLHSLESGLRSDRIFATTEQYQVGDYVRWEWGTQSIGPVWASQSGSSKLLQLYTFSSPFRGSIIGPGQPERTVRISLEPPVVRLRRGEKAPLSALRHVSDGVASWTEPMDSADVLLDDGNVAHPCLSG